MIFKIPKGKHYANPFELPKLVRKKLVVDVVFDESAIYNIPNDNQKDINKLTGMCADFPEFNSSRAGWVWDLKNSKINIYHYSHFNGGEEDWREMGFVDIKEKFRIEFEQSKGWNKMRFQGLTSYYPMPSRPFYYMNKPYFGGQEVAQCDINIKIDIIERI